MKKNYEPGSAASRELSEQARAGMTAREALGGSWYGACLFPVLFLIVLTACAEVTDLFAQSGRFSGILMGFIAELILLLLVSVFYDGGLLYYLTLKRTGNASFSLFLQPFRRQPDRFILIACVKTGAALVCFSPLLVQSFLPPGEGPGFRTELLLFLIGAVLCVLVRIHLLPAVFLLLDHEDMTVLSVLRESLRLMKGKKLTVLKALLPFLGYFVLSLFTLGIALLWIIPYYMTVLAVLWDDLLKKDSRETESFAE